MIKERWPTIYDFEQLQSQIKEVVKSNYIRGFYSLTPKTQELYQGDIIYIDKKFLYINGDGEYNAENYTNYWIVLGNTCDISRNIDDVPFTNIIPIIEFEDSVPINILDGIKNFQNYKSMYIPPFIQEDEKNYFIDFTKILTISKEYFLNKEIKLIKKKELTYSSWILFHACLVRYLARDDGRND